MHKVSKFGTYRAPATKLIDSQGLADSLRQALVVSGKDLGKKSTFPFSLSAIPSQTTRQVFPLHLDHVTLCHSVPAVTKAQLANLRWDCERSGCDQRRKYVKQMFVSPGRREL
jgi:hypothetical protein